MGNAAEGWGAAAAAMINDLYKCVGDRCYSSDGRSAFASDSLRALDVRQLRQYVASTYDWRVKAFLLPHYVPCNAARFGLALQDGDSKRRKTMVLTARL
jgi:hypothetical protein